MLVMWIIALKRQLGSKKRNRSFSSVEKTYAKHIVNIDAKGVT
jgi:hypothetical protein